MRMRILGWLGALGMAAMLAGPAQAAPLTTGADLVREDQPALVQTVQWGWGHRHHHHGWGHRHHHHGWGHRHHHHGWGHHHHRPWGWGHRHHHHGWGHHHHHGWGHHHHHRRHHFW